MIDNKKIEEAALGYCAKCSDITNRNVDLDEDECVDLYNGFIDGAKWAINEFIKDLWHDIDENPKKYHKCLVEVVYHRPLNMTDEIDYVTSHLTKFGWDESSFKRSDYTINRWIYIDNLLKGCNHD